MTDNEHPAAKAGRFFRAAGLAVGKATAAAREGPARPAAATPQPPPAAAQGDAVPIPPREHRAAKAGRYVRAAGIVIGKEVDRRAAVAAARPAPAPPPPPPAPVPTGGFFGKAVFRFFLLALVVLVLTLLRLPDVVPAHERAIVRLVMAAILGLEAVLLTSNWHLANQRIGQRLLTRMWGARGPMNRRERGFARMTRDVLILIGIGFLAAALFQVLVAAGLGPG